MNKSTWLGALALVAIAAVVTAFFLRTGSRHEEPGGGDAAPEGVAARGGAQVQERLQELSEARSRGVRIGPSGKIDVAPQAPAASAPDHSQRAHEMARGNPHEQAQDVARDPAFIDPQPEDLPTLKTMALHDGDPQRRLAAVTLLGASEDPEVIPILAQALSDQDEDVRMAAVQSLADFTGEAPIDAIEGALNDPSADVRYEALEVLSDIGGDRARRAVQRALNDPDEDVQELAQSILDFESDDDTR